MNTILFITRQGTSNFFHKAVSILLIVTLLVICPPVFGEIQLENAAAAEKKIHPDPVTTPQGIKANKSLPSFKPVQSGDLKFSNEPTDKEIFQKSPFEEPLVPIGGKSNLSENKELADALVKFSKRSGRDDYSSLESFLSSHPQSVWRLALLMNLGWLYRQTGWYSKAMDAWQTAWNEGQKITDSTAQPLINRILAEYLVLNARVGRLDVLESLVKTADQRNFQGSSKEKLESAKQAIVTMKTHPEIAFYCGPFAVEKIYNLANDNDPTKMKVQTTKSTSQGTNLLQLKNLAEKLGLSYQVAKRGLGAEIIAPAVIHWKLGHFAAILDRKGDLWHLHDPTFGTDVWVSQKAIDAEASGYFLVKDQTLPSGWSKVSDTEAATIWGKGTNSGGDPNASGDPNPKCGCNRNGGSNGMAGYAFYEMLASLSVFDTPLFYQPSLGPKVEFKVTYSQREANQPSAFTYSNLGPLWTFNWLSYITDDPTHSGADVTQYESGGGTLTYTGYNSSTNTYATQADTGGVLKIVNSSTYELDMPDGSKQIFSAANNAFSRQIFMTQMIDAHGNALNFSYDANFRMVAVTDAMGQVTTLSYGLSSDSYKITQVTDPFGRTATLTYNADGTLHSSQDMIGIVSTYNYTSGSLTGLTTPYGTTSFDVGQDSNRRWIQATDPQGGTERLETWNNENPNVPTSAPVYPTGTYPNNVDNEILNLRNTFYWDKKAMLQSPGVYTQAVITHWYHDYNNFSLMGREVESIKQPLESRVYYNYPGQGDFTFHIVAGSVGVPRLVQRILDDGTTQQYFKTYNAINNVTQQIDPLGRTTNFTYAANSVDLTQVTQVNGTKNDVLFTATYNNQHLPLTTTDASGQVTSYTYTALGQIQTVTNPKNETTTYAYNANNQLISVTGAQAGSTTTLTYDGFNRVRTVTDVNGFTLTYDYDSLNRLTKTTYPDGTYEQNVYTNLDITQQRDRQGRWTRLFYNKTQQLIAVIDPADRVTNYDRCICGQLKGIVDPLGHRTSWNQDIEGRVTSKTYPDGSQILTTYGNNTSRIQTVTDPKGQVRNYTYNEDDSPQHVAYTNAAIATPTVSYTYDPAYPRISTMTDGTGTTTYTYNPVNGSLGSGQLGSVTGPLGPTSTIALTYDPLGRVVGTSINGTSNSSRITLDSLGRLASATNVLGTFTYGYVGATPRVQSISSTKGPSTNYSYFTTANDVRLSEIQNVMGTTALSKFDYTYNKVGTIASWQQQTDSSTPTLWNYQYDGANQLLAAVKSNTSTSAVLANYVYGYDTAGNRTSEQIGLSTTQTTYNADNQITSQSSGGPVRFTGTLNKPATVTVAGNPAQVDANNNFSGSATLTPGTNVVPIVATDENGVSVTNKFQVVMPTKPTASPTYDLNGNLTSDGAGKTFTWDAKDELVGIGYASGASTAFTYDGLGRRVKIVEKNASGTVTSTKQHLWLGNTIAEERDANDAVQKRFFGQGVQIGSANYFYTRDHLGSIREMLNASGAIVARYDYDPFGRTTLFQGTNLADFQYAGMYEHGTSGLNLTFAGDGVSTGRPYDPNTGRFIGRDPLKDSEMTDGPNVYDYVKNDPINEIDPLGLFGLGGGERLKPPPDPCGCGQHLEFEPSIFSQTRNRMGVTNTTTIMGGGMTAVTNPYALKPLLPTGAVKIIGPLGSLLSAYNAAVTIGAALGSFRCVPNK